LKTLTEIIYSYKNARFSWDNLDCCTFAANVVYEFKGLCPPNLRDIENYKNEKGMIKWLKKMGCEDLSEAPTKFLNVERRDISTVKHGDFVYFKNEDGSGSIGVCNGVRAYFIHRDKGLVATPVINCIYCWSLNNG